MGLRPTPQFLYEIQLFERGGYVNRGEFAEKLRTGKITDYTKYIKGDKAGYKGFREELARQGICVEQLIERGEPGVKQRLIENGYAKEYYEKWANEGDPNVSQTLVAYGYCLDILSESTNEKYILRLFIQNRQNINGLNGQKQLATKSDGPWGGTMNVPKYSRMTQLTKYGLMWWQEIHNISVVSLEKRDMTPLRLSKKY